MASESGNGESTLLDLLRACDLARYLEEYTLTRLVSRAELTDISAGTWFSTWEPESPPALLFLYSGVAELRPCAQTGQPVTAVSDSILKTVTSGTCLQSALELFSLFSSTISLSNSARPAVSLPGGCGQYHALTDVRLAKIPLGGSRGVVKEVYCPITLALLKKLYSVTFYFGHTHLGLGREVLRSEEAFNTSPRCQVPRRPSPPRHTESFPLDLHSSIARQRNTTEDSSVSPRGRPRFLSVNSTNSDVYLAPKPWARRSPSPNLTLRTRVATNGLLAAGPHYSVSVSSPSVLSSTERNDNVFAAFDTTSHNGYDDAARQGVAEALLSALGRYAVRYNRFGVTDSFRDLEAPKPPQELVLRAASTLVMVSFEENTNVLGRGERYPGVGVILSGSIAAAADTGHDQPEQNGKLRGNDTDHPLASPQWHSFFLGPGDVVGYGALIFNSRSLFTFKATTSATLGIIPRSFIRQLIDGWPELVVVAGENMGRALSPVLSLLDSSLDVTTLTPGRHVYEQGDASESIHLVVKGRMRTKEVMGNSEETKPKEVGRGEMLGAVEVFINQPRLSTFTAIRKSRVATLQLTSIQCLTSFESSVVFELWRSIHHILADSAHVIGNPPPMLPARNPEQSRTIAVLPLSVEVSVERFVGLLSTAMSDLGLYRAGEIVVAGADGILPFMGVSAFSKAGNAHLEDYLDHLEESAKLSILVGDHSVHSTWNDACVAAADYIILLAMQDDNPDVSDMEKQLESRGALAQKLLVLLEDEVGPDPVPVTRPWIEKRLWTFDTASHMTSVRMNSIHGNRDLERLARRITGRSIAVVLGGGGARGFAHLGVLQALEEEGIPIDILGGTSMGAFVGSHYATTLSVMRAYEAAKKFSGIAQWWKFLGDVTVPVLSLTTGAHLNKAVKATVNTRLDSSDLRLEFYCNVTNLNRGSRPQTLYPQPRPLWQMVRATMTVCPIFPPFVIDGTRDMLVDGAFSANVPVTPALKLGAQIVLAFDVSDTIPPPRQTLGPTVSGWPLLFASFCGPRKKMEGPSSLSSPRVAIGGKGGVLGSLDILETLVFSTTSNETNNIKRLAECHYLMLPVGHIGTFAMNKLDEAKKIGYQHAKTWLKELKVSGKLDHLAIGK